MHLKIYNPETLTSFTQHISEGFCEIGISLTSAKFDLALVQLHGSPLSKEEDLENLEQSLALDCPTVYLIHRPDEILNNTDILNILKQRKLKYILLGDLVFSIPFWKERQDDCVVIPHPFLCMAIPKKMNQKLIVGAYTSWGEMRKLEHFVALGRELKECEGLEFRIGGSGILKENLPAWITYEEKFFVPHFNVQLYHLNGKKRIGETSGSLHRGISIPIIFEANNAEIIEGLHVIKIQANSELTDIDYKDAGQRIVEYSKNIEILLEHNQKQATKNQPVNFAQAVIKFARTIYSVRDLV